GAQDSSVAQCPGPDACASVSCAAGSGIEGSLCHRATVHGAVVSLVAFLALALVGCGTAKKTPTSSASAIGVNGRPIGKLSTPGTPKGEQTVRIDVIAKTGAQRAALALVPVYVHNRGPFLFALDTGASRSLVSSGLVRELHLPQ